MQDCSTVLPLTRHKKKKEQDDNVFHLTKKQARRSGPEIFHANCLQVTPTHGVYLENGTQTGLTVGIYYYNIYTKRRQQLHFV